MTAGRVQSAFQLLQRPKQSVDTLPSLRILLPHLLNRGGEWPFIDQPGAVDRASTTGWMVLCTVSSRFRWANWFITSVPPRIPWQAGRLPGQYHDF